MKLKLMLLKKEIENHQHDLDTFLREYIEKYKGELLQFGNDKNLYFCSKYNNKKILVKIDVFQIDLNDEAGYDNLIKLIESALDTAFKDINKKFPKKYDDDYVLIGSKDDIMSKIENIIFYEKDELNDIFDLIGKIFISILEGHRFRNGNKRFTFFFLMCLLSKFKFYLKASDFNSDLEENYYLTDMNYRQENDLFCFVTRLSNRNFEDLKLLLDSKNIDKDSQVQNMIKNCFLIIDSNDSNLLIKERQEKVKNEIKEWIQKNTLFSKIW
ncbi:type II toxin-antitoxin system death-on-curing family toxin [Mycoplasma sp. 888]|uniref:type II toxin-antitoxin system death-on-curing family toxin n=1 Tax=Mycoplasma sp. 888 TaxID=3108483 RepID=UPI002D781D43|nr:type II toxin-antitoxin system death-on-curing family toxin [Mycoplasma sp. 888]WRQ25543.1 type II toxin-antitoxin system death-on-curing family toxin [Mycoplasma sp. 888]